MLRTNNFLGLVVCKHRNELITEIRFETLKYNNNKMCQHKNLHGPYKYKNIKKLKNSSEINKANTLWPPSDY
jgi:hypothetical protein